MPTVSDVTAALRGATSSETAKHAISVDVEAVGKLY